MPKHKSREDMTICECLNRELDIFQCLEPCACCCHELRAKIRKLEQDIEDLKGEVEVAYEDRLFGTPLN